MANINTIKNAMIKRASLMDSLKDWATDPANAGEVAGLAAIPTVMWGSALIPGLRKRPGLRFLLSLGGYFGGQYLGNKYLKPYMIDRAWNKAWNSTIQNSEIGNEVQNAIKTQDTYNDRTNTTNWSVDETSKIAPPPTKKNVSPVGDINTNKTLTA